MLLSLSSKSLTDSRDGLNQLFLLQLVDEDCFNVNIQLCVKLFFIMIEPMYIIDIGYV